ncbi:MAG: hypothetical protein J7J11_02310 [Desulfurococcales archaeon]|nr:hypothetical protein [Desulfurococcales archaeon]
MRRLLDIKDVIEWIRKQRLRFINARRVARNFKVSSKVAGYTLRKLRDLGYLKVYNRRKGRFIVYKVSEVVFRQ